MTEHDGIYIGNGEVVHMLSNEGAANKETGVEVGKLYPHFLKNEDDTITVKVRIMLI